MTTSSDQLNWEPTASIDILMKRAKVIQRVREFFSDRCILEVTTPTLSHYGVTDRHLRTFTTEFQADPQTTKRDMLSLITSPEYHMKRLLAAGSGPIYQIGHCFRNQENVGTYHNPEFTMLEWYRVHFDMMQLINEVDDLLQFILDCDTADKITYQCAFMKYTQLDPLTCSFEELVSAFKRLDIDFDTTGCDAETLEQVLFSLQIQPNLGADRPVAIYYFPTAQAALAEINAEDQRVAQRFEFYYQGIELANGFKELTDAEEQLKRFQKDNEAREAMGLPAETIDPLFIAALPHMPSCAGVALGLDRLIMLALGATEIKEVMSFNFENA